MTRNFWVPVVTGLIIKDNKILIGLRPEGKNLSGKWEFPGGKIETNESPEEALTRELKEELDIDINEPKLIYANTHNYGDMSVLLIFYKIIFWRGQPKSQHHSQLEWVDLEASLKYDQPEANKKFLPKIIGLLRNE